MRINDLAPNEGSRKDRKRVGRGPGSGHGKTACRGHKGQKARSGGGSKAGFEGGQMPLQRRLPKRGFTNIFKKEYSILNVGDLGSFDSDSVLDCAALIQAGLVKGMKDGIKLLGDGTISHPINIKVHKISKTAREKIVAVGGKVELL